MQEVYKAIGRVASQDVTVLILGDSGTGKELVARAGKPRWAFDPSNPRKAELVARVGELAAARLAEIFTTVHEKHSRAEAIRRLFEEVGQSVGAGDDSLKGSIREAFEEVEKAAVRRLIGGRTPNASAVRRTTFVGWPAIPVGSALPMKWSG